MCVWGGISKAVDCGILSPNSVVLSSLNGRRQCLAFQRLDAKMEVGRGDTQESSILSKEKVRRRDRRRDCSRGNQEG